MDRLSRRSQGRAPIANGFFRGLADGGARSGKAVAGRRTTRSAGAADPSRTRAAPGKIGGRVEDRRSRPPGMAIMELQRRTIQKLLRDDFPGTTPLVVAAAERDAVGADLKARLGRFEGVD